MERDFFMNSEDALKYEIIDKVITKREIQSESKSPKYSDVWL